MSVIKPFQAYVYNPIKITDMAKVVCPPYDVISPEQEIVLQKRSPYNFIHMMLAKADAKQTEDDKRYEKAGAMFQKWVKDEVLVQDKKPCIYYTKQEYKILGQKQSRMGFFAAMKIEDEKARIFPHEKTHAGAKEDRFRLWSALQAACSPIFVCFSDKQKKVETTFQRSVSLAKPYIDVVDDEGTRNRSGVWKIRSRSGRSWRPSITRTCSSRTGITVMRCPGVTAK